MLRDGLVCFTADRVQRRPGFCSSPNRFLLEVGFLLFQSLSYLSAMIQN